MVKVVTIDGQGCKADGLPKATEPLHMTWIKLPSRQTLKNDEQGRKPKGKARKTEDYPTQKDKMDRLISRTKTIPTEFPNKLKKLTRFPKQTGILTRTSPGTITD